MTPSSHVEPPKPESARRDTILRAVIPVFGKLGYRRASMDNLATAAGLSKPGLYLHFASKDEVFEAAMRLYLMDGLAGVEQQLNQPGATLHTRLLHAMDAWFGRHMRTFTPASFDVIAAGDHLSPDDIEQAKQAFRSLLASAIAQAPEYGARAQLCSPEEIAAVLFQLGLSWKQHGITRRRFLASVSLGIRACCQIEADDTSTPTEDDLS